MSSSLSTELASLSPEPGAAAAREEKADNGNNDSESGTSAITVSDTDPSSSAPSPSIPSSSSSSSTPSSLVTALQLAMSAERAYEAERQLEAGKTQEQKTQEKARFNAQLKSKYGKWSPFVRFGYSALHAIDVTGEAIADFLGITDSRYQYVIDAQERHKRVLEQERLEKEAEKAARRQALEEQAKERSNEEAMETGTVTQMGQGENVYSIGGDQEIDEKKDTEEDSISPSTGDDGDRLAMAGPPVVEQIGGFQLPTGVPVDSDRYSAAAAREMLNGI